jgi:hypothetical protein
VLVLGHENVVFANADKGLHFDSVLFGVKVFGVELL